MMSFSEFVNDTSVNSTILFISSLTILTLSAYFGKLIFTRKKVNEKITDDEVKIILGAILSLLGLMIGFVLSISINGYNQRQQTEENEAIAIGNAYQRIQLLDNREHEKAMTLLQQYIEARIGFFRSGVSDENNQWKDISLEKQSALWNIGIQEAHKSSNPIILSVLTAFSELYTSQQKTQASWRHQIPNIAWFLLIFFAISANILIGYNLRGTKGQNGLVFILPFLTTLALFMIAEIDVPGEGVIHVTPDDLVSLQTFLFATK